MISVIIPAYNTRKYLSECLESICWQTLPPAEILVIDDSSPEPMDDIVEAFSAYSGTPPIRLIRHEVNRGQAAARNTGIREAKGDVLAFIDSDDVWAPKHLEQAVDTMRQRQLDLVFCPAALFEKSICEPPKAILRPVSEAEKSIDALALLERCFIIMSSVVARADIIRAGGGFDESPSMRAVEDLDLFIRLLGKGGRLGIAPDATLFYRKHPESATGRPAYMAYQSAHVRQKHIWNVGGSIFRKCSLVARHWWAATRLIPRSDPRWGNAFYRALLWSLPAPWEMMRGVIRWYRRRR